MDSESVDQQGPSLVSSRNQIFRMGPTLVKVCKKKNNTMITASRGSFLYRFDEILNIFCFWSSLAGFQWSREMCWPFNKKRKKISARWGSFLYRFDSVLKIHVFGLQLLDVPDTMSDCVYSGARQNISTCLVDHLVRATVHHSYARGFPRQACSNEDSHVLSGLQVFVYYGSNNLTRASNSMSIVLSTICECSVTMSLCF